MDSVTEGEKGLGQENSSTFQSPHFGKFIWGGEGGLMDDTARINCEIGGGCTQYLGSSEFHLRMNICTDFSPKLVIQSVCQSVKGM